MDPRLEGQGLATAGKKPVKNVELWQRAGRLLQRRRPRRRLALGARPRRRPRQRARRRAGQPGRGVALGVARQPCKAPVKAGPQRGLRRWTAGIAHAVRRTCCYIGELACSVTRSAACPTDQLHGIEVNLHRGRRRRHRRRLGRRLVVPEQARQAGDRGRSAGAGARRRRPARPPRAGAGRPPCGGSGAGSRPCASPTTRRPSAPCARARA